MMKIDEVYIYIYVVCTVTSFAMAESVLLVPGERRLDLETTEGVMIQARSMRSARQ